MRWPALPTPPTVVQAWREWAAVGEAARRRGGGKLHGSGSRRRALHPSRSPRRRVCLVLVLGMLLFVSSLLHYTRRHRLRSEAERRERQRHRALRTDLQRLQAELAQRAAGPTAPTAPLRLALVRPFTSAQVELLERRTREWWQLEHAAPCAWCSAGAAADPPADWHAELIFYYSATREQHAATDAAVRRRLLAAAALHASGAAHRHGGGDRAPSCFDAVHFWVHTVDDARADCHPDASCLAFYALLSRLTPSVADRPRTVPRYSHLFWMEPDVVPIRPRWLDRSLYRLVQQAAAPEAAWLVGSVSHDPVGDYRDYHLNGNALYAVGQPAFVHDYVQQRVMRKYARTARVPFVDGCSGTSYGGFDVSLSRYLYDANMTRDEWAYVQRTLHRFRATEVVVNMGNGKRWRPWQLIGDADAAVALVHGKAANAVRDVWDPDDPGWPDAGQVETAPEMQDVQRFLEVLLQAMQTQPPSMSAASDDPLWKHLPACLSDNDLATLVRYGAFPPPALRAWIARQTRQERPLPPPFA
eukprot:ctg_950.g436